MESSRTIRHVQFPFPLTFKMLISFENLGRVLHSCLRTKYFIAMYWYFTIMETHIQILNVFDMLGVFTPAILLQV